MKQIRNRFLPFLMVIALLSLASAAQDDETMVLVAAQASLVRAQSWIDFLKKNEVAVDHYVVSELDKIKNRKFITIMGGFDEAGIRDIIAELVGVSESSSLAAKGAKRMFLKENVWEPGQKVLIFAGSDAEAAAAVRAESRNTWIKYLEEWFDLGEGPGGLRAY